MGDSYKVKLFVSYSHKDRELCDELQKHLTPLRLANLIEDWHDKEILPGDAWDNEIRKHLQSADIVVFLLSADFLSSTYIYENEIKVAFEKHHNGEIVIVPVMVRKCDIEMTGFDLIQGLPRDLVPVVSSKWHSRDDAYFEVVSGLKKIIVNLRDKKEKVRQKDEALAPAELKKAEEYSKSRNYNAAFPIYYKYRVHSLFRPDHQVMLGYMYENGFGVKQSYADAIIWYRRGAEHGNAYGQCKLGFMYKNGSGVEQDYAEAVRWYRESAEQGDASGQFGLGVMYELGLGVTQDYIEAVDWYKKAAEQGNANAQYSLGAIYEFGFGVDEDEIAAFYWYQKAAEQGNADGQQSLGFLYDTGSGVKQDYFEAAKWYRKAAEQGNASGVAGLAYMYEAGNGVKQDMNRAKELFKNAAVQGNDYAIKACSRLGVKF